MKCEAKVVGRIEIPKDSRITLDHAQVSGQDYSQRKLMQFCAIGSRLEGCRFDKMRIDHGVFGAGREMSEYIDCTFDRARITRCVGNVRFVRCSFRDVSLDNWRCFNVEMVDCVFSGRLRVGFFNGAVDKEDREFLHRERNEFHGNDFSEMDLIDVAFRTGIDLTRQRLPTGPAYLYIPNAAATLEKTRSEVLTWPDTELRESAMIFLKGYSDDVIRDGQQQMFLRASDYYPYKSLSRVMIDKLFVLLRENTK